MVALVIVSWVSLFGFLAGYFLGFTAGYPVLEVLMQVLEKI